MLQDERLAARTLRGSGGGALQSTATAAAAAARTHRQQRVYTIRQCRRAGSGVSLAGGKPCLGCMPAGMYAAGPGGRRRVAAPAAAHSWIGQQAEHNQQQEQQHQPAKLPNRSSHQGRVWLRHMQPLPTFRNHTTHSPLHKPKPLRLASVHSMQVRLQKEAGSLPSMHMHTHRPTHLLQPPNEHLPPAQIA